MATRLFSFMTFLLLAPIVLPEPTSLPTSVPDPKVEDGSLPEASGEEPPEGYYAFVESPNATPPRVRPPPYRQIATECPGADSSKPHVSAHNLCGDLNRGLIPKNPMGQAVNGEPYPFELIRNQTLRFLSKTLPVLRADDTLPRVKHITASEQAEFQHNRLEERSKRSVSEADSKVIPNSDAIPSHALEMEHRSADSPRESRKFCDGGGVFCMLYRAINGDSEAAAGVERREDPGPQPHAATHHRYEGPPTPCPARVEYATPVFARNYQGVWRYVVQIPYEGYFTQTVEVTRCMQSRCHYLEGGCLSSPRWVSLLVAELHYPTQMQSIPDYQPYLQNRGNQPEQETSTDKPPHCDGHDEMGCFQVRLYYDWFLVPGSCKCWRPDYFARYVRRRQNNEL
ncbi:hypothetical protein K1T71_012484 [Dendrolimus kikuchii]|uniref:Uncharacterized protein n=1 Tax=Dendrolimus kikuchii TaxID=765133 RepID=A0ACC1CJG4_9NEOP|nr:hypothetical protein K1T71_012484 [Dendrolimus kikuchii]